MEISKESKIRKEWKKWTLIEDNFLKEAIIKYGENDWDKITNFVGNNRTKAQCRQRWLRDLNPLIKREKWSYSEDLLLNNLILKYGTKSWTKISNELRTRSDVQCRFRYFHFLKKDNLIIKKLHDIFEKISNEIDNLNFIDFSWDDNIFFN